MFGDLREKEFELWSQQYIVIISKKIKIKLSKKTCDGQSTNIGICEVWGIKAKNLRVRLDGRVENWEGGKLVVGWKIGMIENIQFSLVCVFGWRDGKVGGQKTLLFD